MEFIQDPGPFTIITIDNVGCLPDHPTSQLATLFVEETPPTITSYSIFPSTKIPFKERNAKTSLPAQKPQKTRADLATSRSDLAKDDADRPRRHAKNDAAPPRYSSWIGSGAVELATPAHALRYHQRAKPADALSDAGRGHCGRGVQENRVMKREEKNKAHGNIGTPPSFGLNVHLQGGVLRSLSRFHPTLQ